MINVNDTFDQEMKSLFEQSIEILNNRYTINLGEPKPVLKYLKRYNQFYKATLPSEHFIYFKSIFDNHQKVIIKSLEDDSWLKKGNIVIQFGAHLPQLKGKCLDIKIKLSKIYNCAIELQESAYNVIADMNQEMLEPSKDIIRPSIFMLHLLRIFYCVCNKENQDLLLPSISSLESDLGVKNRLSQPASTLPFANIMNMFSGLTDDPEGSVLAPAFEGITSMLKQGNHDIPDNIKAPSNKVLLGYINDIVNMEGVKETYSKVSSAVNNKDDLMTTIGNLAKNVDPNIFTTMYDQFVKTVPASTTTIKNDN